MEEKKERKKAVAKKIITPNMHEWLPVSPKMPEKMVESEESKLDLEDIEADNEHAEAKGTSIDFDLSDDTRLDDIDSDDTVDLTTDEEDEELDDIEPDMDEFEDKDSENIDSENIVSDIDVVELEKDSELEEDESEIEPVVYEPIKEEPHSRVALSDNKSGLGMGWYVVHTYSGYENKVKANIEKAIENRHLENEILEVRVPLQEVMEMKNGVEKTSQKKLFPGYVLLHMDADNNDAWYVVRNTRGVTGFVGPGSKPVPLTEEELKALEFGSEVTDVEYSVGDVINVIAGVWKDTVGTVQELDAIRKTVTINVEMFGRETPVEINFSDIKKMWD